MPRAEMEEIHAMMAQSLAISDDPYNKMHGRCVEHWQNDDDERNQRLVWLHTSDRLPRRRKKKGKGRKEEHDSEDEEAALARAWRTSCRTTRHLYGASSAFNRGPDVDHCGGAKGATSKGLSSQSGSSNIVAPASSSSQRMPTSSGSSTGAARPSTVLSMTLRSGSSSASGDASASLNLTSQSGTHGAAVVDDPLCMTSHSGRRGAAVVDDPSSQRMTSSSGSVGEHAAAERGSNVSQSNPWNDFQREFADRRWGSDKMRAEYWRYKSTGKKPV